MEGLTASEIAGFGVGALLLCATIAAPRVDGFIASSQRRSLGMCKRCGDLRMVACSQCKGVGSVRKGGIFTFGMLDDIYESLGAETKANKLVAQSADLKVVSCVQSAPRSDDHSVAIVYGNIMFLFRACKYYCCYEQWLSYTSSCINELEYAIQL